MRDAKRPMNLFETYRFIEKREGRNLTELLAVLNDRHGTNYKHGRWSEWEAGTRRPSPEIVDDILRQVLPRLLHDESLPKAVAARITRECALPELLK